MTFQKADFEVASQMRLLAASCQFKPDFVVDSILN